jgi:acyl transferase domain-containing protein/thioesterase domain-containing protein/acyl carrier protein
MTDAHDAPPDAIAIIGMSGRFPGAGSVAEFWQHLVDGVESVREFSDEELLAAGVDRASIADPRFVRAGAVLDDIEGFDHRFFGLTPREAALTDPQHRMFLECAWEAFESAGYAPGTMRGSVGVFAGGGTSDYLLYHLGSNPELLRSLDYMDMTIANDRDQMPTRVSYKLNLTGPSIAVQTACSTSLVATHLACESLLNQQCDLAIAGGASIKLPQAGYVHHEGGVASPDGHVRTFDASAQGAVFGSGVGVVVLKRLGEALADGDHIYAVIRGSAVNNDGAAKVGYTAPSVEGQRRVIAEALAAADVDADTIGYVEAHGTATALGDPIEITALTQAYAATTARTGFARIGSVKTNVGHLVAAAGVTGLIKTALSLHHELIPASLHYESPNPAIDFAASPFSVVSERTAWPRGAQPRRAGVSSFGIGGTNAHVVLEEAPAVAPSTASARPYQLLPISAQTEGPLEAATGRLAEHLRTEPAQQLADIAYTLQSGRRAFARRRAVVAHDAAAAAAAIEARDAKLVVGATAEARARSVAFMFPGGGAQYAGMARELYETEPLFRREIDHCVELLMPHLGADLRDYLYPVGEGAAERAQELNRPKYAMPSLFVVGYALAQLLQAWGVRPGAMIGHSVGEYVAATLAGVVQLSDALALVALRGRLFETMAPGAMISVQLPEAELRPLLGSALDIAAINAPALCVATGPEVDVDALERTLRERGVEFSRLHLAIAAHSRLVDPILGEFRALLDRIELRAPALPFVSDVSGTWITDAEATDPAYWERHLRSTVRFADGVGELLRDPDRVLLEVGPGQTLTTLSRLHADRAPDQSIVQTTRHPREEGSDAAFLFATLGRLWATGVEIDWQALHAGEQRRRVPLPTYPFEHQRHWIEVGRGQQPVVAAATKRADMTDWFYAPSWRRTGPLAPAQLGAPERWLIFADALGASAALAQRLRAAGHEVVTVEAGRGWQAFGRDRYRIDPRREEDYRALVRALHESGRAPRRIVHAWSLAAPGKGGGEDAFASAQATGFHSLLFLAHALDAAGGTEPLSIVALANGLADVGAHDLVLPERATLLAPLKVIAQEYPHIDCRAIDVPLEEARGGAAAALAERVLAEATADSADVFVALRAGQRWVQHFEPAPLPATQERRALRSGGVYLITGGLGQLGFAMAEQLAIAAQAKLVLTGRSELPPRAEWSRWLESHPEQDGVSQRIRRVERLEARGAEVLVVSADVADEAAMRAVVAQAEQRFGALHGVIHCAGLIENGAIFLPLRQMGATEAERQFRPKVHGLYVLERVLGSRPLDVRYLVSSNAAILGGLGHVAYSAANLFVDAYAGARAQSATPWVSVNWDLFHGDDTAPGGPRTSVDVYAIGPREAAAAFGRTLTAAPAGQTVMSTGDIELRLATWIRRDSVRAARAPEGTADAVTPAAQVALPASYIAPSTEAERAIAGMWQSLLGVNPVGIRDNYFELGGHSLIAVQLFAQIEQRFGQKLPLATLFQAPTVEQLAALLEAPEPAAQVQWGSLVPLREAGERAPFFCVHGGGGNVLNFRDLAEELGTGQPVFALQAEGLDHEDMPQDRVEDTAARYVAEIRAVQPHGPYYLGGYSYGGLVAWEMAQQLHRQGEPVGLLALIETYAPGHQETLAFRRHWYRERTRMHVHRLRSMRLRDWPPYVARRYRTVRWRIGAWLRSRAWQLRYRGYRVLRRPIPASLVNHMEVAFYAASRYEPARYEGQPVLFVARDRGVEGAADPSFGWAGRSTVPVDVCHVPGDHHSLLESPHVRGLAEELRARLEHPVGANGRGPSHSERETAGAGAAARE